MEEPKTINELIRRIAAGEKIEDHMAMIERDHSWIIRFEICGESEAEIEAYRELYAVAKSIEATKPRVRYIEQDLSGLYASRERALWDE